MQFAHYSATGSRAPVADEYKKHFNLWARRGISWGKRQLEEASNFFGCLPYFPSHWCSESIVGCPTYLSKSIAYLHFEPFWARLFLTRTSVSFALHWPQLPRPYFPWPPLPLTTATKSLSPFFIPCLWRNPAYLLSSSVDTNNHISPRDVLRAIVSTWCERLVLVVGQRLQLGG